MWQPLENSDGESMRLWSGDATLSAMIFPDNSGTGWRAGVTCIEGPTFRFKLDPIYDSKEQARTEIELWLYKMGFMRNVLDEGNLLASSSDEATEEGLVYAGALKRVLDQVPDYYYILYDRADARFANVYLGPADSDEDILETLREPSATIDLWNANITWWRVSTTSY